MSESPVVSQLIVDAQHGEPELERLAFLAPSLDSLINALFDERVFLPQYGWISECVFVLITAYHEVIDGYKDTFIDIIGGAGGETVPLRLMAMKIAAYFEWTECFRLVVGVMTNPYSSRDLVVGAIEASSSLLLADPKLQDTFGNYLAFMFSYAHDVDSLTRMFAGRALIRLGLQFPKWQNTVQDAMQGLGWLNTFFYPLVLLAQIPKFTERIETAYALALYRKNA